jgi:hypothetical protein
MKKHLMTIVLSLCVVSISIAQKIDQSFFDKFPTLENDFADKDLRKLLVEKKFLGAVDTRVINNAMGVTEKIIPIGKLETSKAFILIYGSIGDIDNDLKTAIFAVNTIAFFKTNGEVVPASIRPYILVSGTDFNVKNVAMIEVRDKEFAFTQKETDLSTLETKQSTGVYSVRRNYLAFDRYEE